MSAETWVPAHSGSDLIGWGCGQLKSPTDDATHICSHTCEPPRASVSPLLSLQTPTPSPLFIYAPVFLASCVQGFFYIFRDFNTVSLTE